MLDQLIPAALGAVMLCILLGIASVAAKAWKRFAMAKWGTTKLSEIVFPLPVEPDDEP